MKTLLILILSFGVLSLNVIAQDSKVKEQDSKVIKQEVEAACGQCQFGLKGDGCDLAVRIDGKAYWVEGSDIEDHGDAHSTHGFCNTVRKANVEGKVKNGKFKATQFELMDVEKKIE